MKSKILFTVLIMILPMIIAPVQAGQGLAITQDSVGFDQIEVLDNKMPTNQYATADEAYLDTWRNLLNSYESPNIDYTIKTGDFTPNDVSDYIQPYVESDSGISLNAPPELKKSKGIHIDSEKDFNKYDGSGTVDDPYLIEGYAISDTRNNLIHIENINAYVLIRGNLMDGEHSGLANIVVQNSQHVTFVNNNVSNNDAGFVVSGSSDITISNNNVNGHYGEAFLVASSSNVDVSNNNIDTNGFGVVFDGSSSSTITSNTITNNQDNGITLAYSTGITIDGNSVFDNGANGIFFQDSDGNVVTNNEVYNNGPDSSTSTNSIDLLSFDGSHIVLDATFAGNGIYLDPSVDNVVAGNNVYDNDQMGIFLEYSDSTLIDSNTVTSNGLSGIFFIDSNNNNITNNDITLNGDSSSLSSALNGLSPMDYVTLATFAGNGIYLDPSFDNLISGNNIANNLGEGIFLEYSGGTSIDSNTVTGNGLNGIMFLDSDSNSITNNEIAGNGATASALIANANLSPLEAKLTATFAGNGIYLDPSHDNLVDNNVLLGNEFSGITLFESTTTDISNNQIASNGGDGVTLINSSSNAIFSNLIDSNGQASADLFLNGGITTESLKMYATFAGNGIYLDPSPNNHVYDNVVTNSAATGVYFLDTNSSVIEGNFISGSGAHGVFLQDSSYNSIVENVIEDNGATLTQLSTSLDATFAGNGIYLDPSHGNSIVANNISRSFGDGIFSEASTGSYIDFNRLIENSGYGINFDDQSGTSTVVDNNFIGNDGLSSQGRDDGIGNSISGNWWSDHNNNDTDYDGVADEPYVLDGDAGTTDTAPTNIPEGLNFYNISEMTSNPTKLNADSDGSPLTLKVHLADGFRVLNISLEKLWLNGSVHPFKYHIVDILTFTVTFDRQEVNALVNALGMQPPFVTTFELTGRINDGLLDITGFVDVEINQTETTLILVAGLTGIAAVPAIGKQTNKESKLAKLIKYLKARVSR